MQRRNSARRHFSDTTLFGRIHAPLMPPRHKVLVIACMDIGYVIFSYGDLGLARLSQTYSVLPLETVFQDTRVAPHPFSCCITPTPVGSASFKDATDPLVPFAARHGNRPVPMLRRHSPADTRKDIM